MGSRLPRFLVFFLLVLAGVLFFSSVVTGTAGQENCYDDCPDANVALMGAGVAFAGAVLTVLLFGWATPGTTLRAHCYGCGATTAVRKDQMADDLSQAEWTNVGGQTFCPECSRAPD